MTKRTIIGASLAAGLLISAIALTPKKLVAAVVATLIRDQDAAGRHPFAATCQVVDFSGCGIALPAGEQVVIENASFFGSINNTKPNFTGSFRVTATSAGTSIYPVNVIVPTSAFWNDGSGTFFGATQTTWFAADAGSNLGIYVLANSEGQYNQVNAYCSLTGYYVTLP